MAKPKHKHGRKAPRPKLRNAARPARAPTARAPTANPEVRDTRAQHHQSQPGEAAVYSAAGAAVAAGTCLLLTRFDAMPMLASTALTSAVGAGMAVLGRTPAMQAFGQGTFAAAGAQFGLVLIDKHYQDTVVKAEAVASRPEPKKPSNAESLPPGALEAAYERARRRLAMSEAAGQMAA